MRVRRKQWTSSKEAFDPDDAQRVKHTKIGIWDLYEEVSPELKNVPGAARVEQLNEFRQSAPYIWLMLKDLSSLRSIWLVLSSYVVIKLALSFLPAISLWYSGQMLRIVETAVEKRSVDKALLARVASARFAVSVARRLLNHMKSRFSETLEKRIRAHYSGYTFEAYARVDVPTFDDPIIQRQLDEVAGGRTSVAWESLQMLTDLVANIIQLASQVSVLLAVLKEQRDGVGIALLSLLPAIMRYMRFQKFFMRGVWAATCRNTDYMKLQGLKRLVTDGIHRKEIVAGNLLERLKSDFFRSQKAVGDDAGEFGEIRRKHAMRDRLTSITMLDEPLRELPQIVFALRAAQYPASIPVTLASLSLIQTTVSSVTMSMTHFFDQFGSIAEQLESIRRLYEIKNIPNKIESGTEAYPENSRALESGISVEFRNVSFQYPGSEDFALQDVSFKIEQGQLCVIVGVNGSGKSTILKLITRIYDPTEGEILIDGRDIRLLKLQDLRRVTSVLFQDYTHFPLSIRDNIAFGDPDGPYDEERIEQAARAGGALDFVNKLPEGFSTYLDRPVRDYYSSLPEGTTSLFGRPLDHSSVRSVGRLNSTQSSNLSGGQMQRLAVSRTFMKTIGNDGGVGLLLFDEPSASLDPQAEHDLFERLRKLRGNKTMIFSSHRFGNLTRHADVILFMKDSLVKEMGTHDSLLAQGGDYADVYTLQARAFLP